MPFYFSVFYLGGILTSFISLLLSFECAPLSKGDANELKLIGHFFKSVPLSRADVEELKFLSLYF